jgi:hypothetical protein
MPEATLCFNRHGPVDSSLSPVFNRLVSMWTGPGPGCKTSNPKDWTGPDFKTLESVVSGYVRVQEWCGGSTLTDTALSGHVRHRNDGDDSLTLMQSVVSGYVRALEWFGTSASITAVVSEYVRVLEWCGASS